jgi:hypothetical protein
MRGAASATAAAPRRFDILSDSPEQGTNEFMVNAPKAHAPYEGSRNLFFSYPLIEFQGTVDPWMPVRIMTYIGLLYQDLIKSAQRLITGAGRRRAAKPGC